MFEKKELKTLIIQGGKYQTTFTKKFENRKIWEAPNENHVISFIPGTILDLFIKTGQKVKEGETLLLLEAMKMHNIIAMPFDGVIKKINIKRNQIIPKGYLMIEIARK